MLGLLNCEHHHAPINVIMSRMDSFAAFCQTCFHILSKQEEINQAVRLNTHTLSIFESFTTYVQEKLYQWIVKIRSNDAQAIFEETNQNQNTSVFEKSTLIQKEIANEVIQEYKALIKRNRDSVLSQKIPQILYHNEFLKDIYNLVTKSWKGSANLIASNYSQIIKQKTFKQRQFKINAQLIEEIEKERIKIVNQKLEFVIIKTHPLLQEMNRGNSNKNQTKTNNHCQQNEISQLDNFKGPVLIKRVQSFQEVKPFINSSKTIEEKIQQTNFNRAKNMKKSKLIDLNEYYEINQKYETLLKDFDTLKLENDNLRQQNYSLKSQNRLLYDEKKSLKNQSQKYQVKMNKFILNHSQASSGFFYQRRNNHHQNDIQIENNKHDLRLLIQYVRSLRGSIVLDKNLLNVTINQLKTAHQQL